MAKQNINVGATANDRSGDSLRSAFQKINSNFTELYTALGLNTDTNLNLGAFEFTGSTMSTTDSSSIVIDQATTISSNLTVGGDILPYLANGGNLGSSSNPWHSLYVSNNTIYIGGNAISIDGNGELTLNNNRIVQENGEYLTLDNLIDVNANSPLPGETIVWNGGAWVNGQASASDRLSNAGDEVVLVGGANPFVTFPAITGGDQIQISGAEISALSGNFALTGQTNVTIITNAAGVGGGSNYFTFDANGTLMFPDGTSQSTAAPTLTSQLTNDSGFLTTAVLNNGLDADIKGSVFGDDSSVMVNAIDRTLHSVSVNTLQLNFNISGDNIVAPTGGYITIGHSDGAGGVNNVATFDAGGIRFDQNVVMGNASEVRHDTTNNWLDLNLAGGNVGLASQTGVVGIYADYAGGPYTWLFKDNGSIQFPDMSLQTTAYTGPQTTLDGDVTGSVFADDSTIMVDGVNGVLRANVNVPNTWTVTTGDKTWSFIYGDVSLGTNPIFEFPGSLQAVGSQTGIYAPADDLSGNWGMSIDAANSPYNVDIGEISGSNYWRFSGDGRLYLPSIGGGGGAILRSPLNESIGLSVYNDTGAGATYTLSVATTGPINIPTASTGLGRLQNPDGIEILTNSGATAKMWSFGTDGKLTVPGIIELSNGAQIFNTAGVDDSITIGATGTPGTITFNGSGFFNDDTFFHKAIQEKFSSLQDATGVVTHNCANGHIFYHTSPDANWTVNLTNFSLITNYATAITIIISQGGTGYYPNALQIGGAAQTINWQGNTTPTPSSNRVDVVTFSIINSSGTYTVLGQLTGF